jgi:hypothetical protein
MSMRLPLMIAMALAGCTFDAGNWFGTLAGSLTAAYVPKPERDAGGGWQRLASDYQVRVTSAAVAVQETQLLGGQNVGSLGFDPAKPPPGYTLCHNGHCHATDGRLVSYEDISAELAMRQGGGGLQAVVTLSGAGSLDLLAPSERPLACQPSCNLERTQITRVVVTIETLVLDGVARDGRSPPRFAGERPFHFQRASGEGGAPSTVSVALDLPIDRKHAPRVRLALSLEATAAVLDAIDFASPIPEGRLGEVSLAAAVTRDD